MNPNNNHPNPNVNPPEPNNERGSILKHLLLALALLAVSGSLLYAMVVTKPSAPTTVKPKDAGGLSLVFSKNPCAAGDTVQITFKNAVAPGSGPQIQKDGTTIQGGSASGSDWVVNYQAPNTGVNPTITGRTNYVVQVTANLPVVAVTGISVNSDNNFQASIAPTGNAQATDFANANVTWSGDATVNALATSAAITPSQPVGPITVTATLGTSHVTKNYAVKFNAQTTLPTVLAVGGSAVLKANSTPSNRTIGWKVVSSDPGVSVSFANPTTTDGGNNTLNAAANSAIGNVTVEAYDYQVGAACGVQVT